MPVSIASFFLPRNNNTWYLLEDKYLKGGLRVVADFNERDAIHPANLKAGMLVVTQDTSKIWQLGVDLLTWSELLLGQGSNPSNQMSLYTHRQVGASDIWIINHQKNTRYFTYSVYDATSKQVIPNEVTISSANQVILQFATLTSGHVTLAFDHNVY